MLQISQNHKIIHSKFITVLSKCYKIKVNHKIFQLINLNNLKQKNNRQLANKKINKKFKLVKKMKRNSILLMKYLCLNNKMSNSKVKYNP